MKRREFLESAMKASSICMACLSACSKSNITEEDPQSASGPWVIDLNTQLLVTGSSISRSDILVIRLTSGNIAQSFSAVQLTCPHAGGTLGWSAGEELIVCPVHGSRFTAGGALVNGPAAVPLKTYRMEIRDNKLLIG